MAESKVKLAGDRKSEVDNERSVSESEEGIGDLKNDGGEKLECDLNDIESYKVPSKKDKTDALLNSNENMSPFSVDGPSQDNQNCYCGKERNLNIVELQCGVCFKWFHEPCISISLGKCVPFMTYYDFLCKQCNGFEVEMFCRKQPNFCQMAGTALANLMQECRSKYGQPRKMFSKDKEIIPYISKHWESLTSMPRRIKQTWHTTLYKAMLNDGKHFVFHENGFDGNPTFGLVNQDLTIIGPGYDFGKGLQRKNTESSHSQGAFYKGRISKRKIIENQSAATRKKVKSELVMPKLPPNGYPLEYPFNKDGYRYFLAEPDPHAPFLQEFDSQYRVGKPIPGWLYRRLSPCNVLIALHDRDHHLKVSEERLSITGERGYCMARATHGVNKGAWYFECTMENVPNEAASRLGWAQALANLQGPVGFDAFSYSWRSLKGTKFHESRGLHYADEGYGQGDTLGFFIDLPSTSREIYLPPVCKDKPLVKFKGFLYYEEKDNVQSELKKLKPLLGSKIVFYKNGLSVGTAFANINAGIYYPAISLFKDCTVSVNFGPAFKYPPKENYKPMCDAAYESTIEQAMADMLYFTENEDILQLDTL